MGSMIEVTKQTNRYLSNLEVNMKIIALIAVATLLAPASSVATTTPEQVAPVAIVTVEGGVGILA